MAIQLVLWARAVQKARAPPVLGTHRQNHQSHQPHPPLQIRQSRLQSHHRQEHRCQYSCPLQKKGEAFLFAVCPDPQAHRHFLPRRHLKQGFRIHHPQLSVSDFDRVCVLRLAVCGRCTCISTILLNDPCLADERGLTYWAHPLASQGRPAQHRLLG